MKKRRSILSRAVAGILVGVLLLSVQVPMNLKGEDALPTEEELPMEATEGSTEWEEFSTEEAGLSVEETETSMQETDAPMEELQILEVIADIPIEEMETGALTGASEQSEEPMELSDETTGYDVTAPVIESVEFLENGQELSAGDTLHLTVKAYDADSGIRKVHACIYDRDGQYPGEIIIELDKTGEGHEYVAEYSLPVLFPAMYSICISVTDIRGNYVVDSYNHTSQNVFSVAGEKITLKSLSIDRQGETLKVGDTIKFEAEIAPAEYMTNGMFESCYVRFGNSYEKQFSSSLSYNKSTNKLEGSYKVKEYDITGKYEVIRVSLYGANLCECYLAERPYFYIDGIDSTVGDKQAVIESISLGDAQGKFLEPGDTVHVSVKVSDTGTIYGNGYISFRSINEGDIVTNYNTRVELTYNGETGCYEGTYILPEDIYPCEWIVDCIYFDYNRAITPSGMCEKSYFRVKNQGTYVEITRNIHLSAYALCSENSDYKCVLNNKEINNVPRRTTLREILGENANILENVGDMNGHKFLGWVWNYGAGLMGDGIGLDDEFIIPYNNCYVALYAKYDFYDANVRLHYIDTNGEVIHESIVVPCEKGETYGEIIDRISRSIKREIYSELEFSGWNCENKYLDLSSVPDRMPDLYFEAEYSGKTAIEIRDEDGWGIIGLMIADGENLSKDAITDLFGKLEEPEPVEGQTFKRWELTGIWNMSKSSAWMKVRARYKECIVELPDCGDPSPQWRQRVLFLQPGEQFTLPTECVGNRTIEYWDEDGSEILKPGEYRYENIRWYDVDTGEQLDTSKSITAKESMLIYGYGDIVKYAASEKPDDKTPGGNTPGSSDQGDKTDTSKSELSAETIEQTVREIREASSGKVIKVDMKDATVVPKEILEAAKGSDVSIVLNMGDYSWTINGKDINASNLKAVNLEVKMDTNAVPSRIVDALSDGNPTRQLSLTHNGDFGFKASLSVNVGAQNSGQYGNLYYYDSNDKLIFQNAGQISADGTVRLDFSHASDYVIVIGKSMQPSSQNQQTGSSNAVPPSGTESGTVLKSPLTGDKIPEFALSLFGVCAILLICCIYRTKESANKNA